MASLPPDTIHVKRKRGTDDAPVDFLRLEGSKRHRSEEGGWVYQRKRVDAERPSHTPESSAPATPIIQSTQDGDEARLFRHLRKPGQVPGLNDATTPGTAPAATAAPGQPTPTAASHTAIERIRRFHLSRSNSPQPAAGVSKKRAVPAVFIERGAKKQRETLKALMQEHNVKPTESPESSGEAQPVEPPSPADQRPVIERQPSPGRKLKRPGTRASTTTRTSKPTLPPSMRGRETTNMDALAQVMDDWTLDEITKNLSKMEEQSTTSKYSPAKSRFKPKAPAKRYFERHPDSLPAKDTANAAPQYGAGTAIMDVDVPVGDTTDEEDYVLETYERVPVERLRDQAVPAHRVGLLVFDTEPDMVDFFYGNESDSEDEFPEDEDDENAENYYAADYPDEDLEWDDEFDRNAYHYTNQNDSDMEEYDERDFIDDVLDKYEQGASIRG